ncbi:unnamed protein product [Somion occarium]|uniref:F-box domain-containing protein n=1 Tax=Somion occarium TaxID=3059160 RepID=A0ABP1CFG4_9APHY
MLPSIFHVLPAELIKQIPFYLSVPELARLLHVSKRFHAFAFKATVEYFKRWGIAPPSKRDFDTSCYVFAFDLLLVLPPDMNLFHLGSFGGFNPQLCDYFMDQYTNTIIDTEHCENYDIMRHVRPANMPLPTKSFAFILVDASPESQEERELGFPSIPVTMFMMFGFRVELFVEELRSKEDRTRYTLGEIDMFPPVKWKKKVVDHGTEIKPVKFFAEQEFRPLNKKGKPVGAKNMRFKIEANFWKEGEQVFYHLFHTVLDWRFSMPFAIV